MDRSRPVGVPLPLGVRAQAPLKSDALEISKSGLPKICAGDKRVTDLCRKCGKEPRSGTQRWGKACIGESVKRSREKNGTKNVDAKNVVPSSADRGPASPESLRRSGGAKGRITSPARHDHATCHRELAMLRLDVERLKGELSVARLATREAGERVMTTLWSSDEARGRVIPTREQAAAAFAKMPADATCGGPGRCGRIGCGHPGW